MKTRPLKSIPIILGIILSGFSVTSPDSLLAKSDIKSDPKINSVKTSNHKKKKSKQEPLAKSTFEEILDRYLFIGDFAEKPAERPVYPEVLWKYPIKLAPQSFPMDLDKNALDAMVFRVRGEGRLAEHFAKGRVEFLNGNYDDAHKTWLSARQQFDKDPVTLKRLEFFLGINAAQVLIKEWKQYNGDLQNPIVRQRINRTSYFLAAAFILRRDIPEPQVDQHAVWALYNLSVFYHKLERWSLVAGSAEEGLTTLLKVGKKDYRSKFRQLLAEVYIKAQDHLAAIQEIDTAIRQDKDQTEAAKLFSRAGDIYFGLNNYELAEDVYALGTRLDELSRAATPTSIAMRGESLFWLGKYEQARNLLEFAVNESIKRDRDWLTTGSMLPWIRLRIADTWLVANQQKGKINAEAIERAKLAYFRVESEHPNTDAAKIAKARGACLELPEFSGQNVKHARSTILEMIQDPSLPAPMIELLEACHVLSYTDRERTSNMVSLVKDFSAKYPMSAYLDRMFPAVKEVQATVIEDYFKQGFDFLATQFFEKRRNMLYTNPSNELEENLFVSYVNTSSSTKAIEFYKAIQPKINSLEELSDEAVLRIICFLSEVTSFPKKDKFAQDLTLIKAKILNRKWNKKSSKKSQEFVKRIIGQPAFVVIGIPLYQLGMNWADSEEDLDCSVRLPILLRLKPKSILKVNESERSNLKFVQNEASAILDTNGEALIKNNYSCAQSFIDLEAAVISRSKLTDSLKNREKWALTSPWLERYWVISEELAHTKQLDTARSMWKRIVDQAPKTSFEYRMAETRLDPTKTEVESLFDGP